MGAEVFTAPRGGEVTFHGPGQMVAYPIVDIRAAGLGAHAFVENLEGAVVSTLGTGWVHAAPCGRAAGLGTRAFVEKLEGAVVSTLGRGGLAPSRRTQASAATQPIPFYSSTDSSSTHASHPSLPRCRARTGRFGIRAEGQVNGATGVWVGDRKIAAVGVKLSHGVRYELSLGLSL